MAQSHLVELFRKSLVPVIVFLALAVGLTTLLVLLGRDPRVDRIEPAVVQPGDTVSVYGRYFGDTPGALQLAGEEIPSMSVTAWADDQIRFVVPQGSDSGLLYVRTDGGSSRGTLVQMQRSVPVSAAPIYSPGAPQIERLAETTMQIGQILVIEGQNFGRQRRASRVLFAGKTDEGVVEALPARISYPVWSDELIHARVPSGVQSGFVTVETAWGLSNPMRLQIDRPAGEIRRTDRSEIAVSFGVSISGVELVADGSSEPDSRDIVIRFPCASSGLGQSEIRYLEPCNVAGALVSEDETTRSFRFEDIDDSFSHGITRTLVANRFGIALDIDPSRVSPVYDSESGFFEYYTKDAAYLAVGDEGIASVAASVRSGRANPYQIAAAAYDWVVSRMDYAIYELDRDPVSGLVRSYGDDYTYSTIFVSILRAARIPARVVAGIVLSGSGAAIPHYWAEFFVPAIGWVPADPAFGDRAYPGGFTEPENPQEFYFGNLDSHRIAFVHGAAPYDHGNREGVDLRPPDPFSLNASYVEAGPDIADLSVEWQPARLISMLSWDDSVGVETAR